MTTGTTTYGDITPREAGFIAKEMLKWAEPTLVLQKLGLTKPLPSRSTQVMKFRRPKTFDAATTPLVEGVTPKAQKFQYEDVDCQLKQYGAPIEVTDVVELTHTDPVISDASVQAGDQAARTTEQVTYGVVKAGTSVFYTTGSTRNAVNVTITKNKQRAVTRALKAQKAKKFTRILDGSPNYGTVPLEAAFIGVGHTDAESDIRNLDKFTSVAEYGTRKPICPEEIGSVEDVRYVLSADLEPWEDAGGVAGSMVSTTGTNADVYPMLYFGMEAFGCVPLKGKNAMTPMVLKPGVPRGGDPLGQRGYVSWKCMYVAVILNQSWMTRLEMAVTDL